MSFQNQKKIFLQKLDKSKKGSIDEAIIPLLSKINSQSDYFTTSSCSGRVLLWKSREKRTAGISLQNHKKNEIEWLKVSHDYIKEDFLEINTEGLVWLRLEPFILHVCCQDLKSAEELLNLSKKTYKKSCLLSISNKIIVEIRGSEFLEIPFQNNTLLFNDLDLLKNLINLKLTQNWEKINNYYKSLSETFPEEII